MIVMEMMIVMMVINSDDNDGYNGYKMTVSPLTGNASMIVSYDIIISCICFMISRYDINSPAMQIWWSFHRRPHWTWIIFVLIPVSISCRTHIEDYDQYHDVDTVSGWGLISWWPSTGSTWWPSRYEGGIWQRGRRWRWWSRWFPRCATPLW